MQFPFVAAVRRCRPISRSEDPRSCQILFQTHYPAFFTPDSGNARRGSVHGSAREIRRKAGLLCSDAGATGLQGWEQAGEGGLRGKRSTVRRWCCSSFGLRIYRVAAFYAGWRGAASEVLPALPVCNRLVWGEPQGEPSPDWDGGEEEEEEQRRQFGVQGVQLLQHTAAGDKKNKKKKKQLQPSLCIMSGPTTNGECDAGFFSLTFQVWGRIRNSTDVWSFCMWLCWRTDSLTYLEPKKTHTTPYKILRDLVRRK